MHTKHGFKEKLKYMKMLEEGYTVDYIKNHYGINDTQLQVMWHKYRIEGISALRDRKCKHHTIEEKIAAIADYEENHLPLVEICLKYDIDKSTIQRWCQLYRQHGASFLITEIDKTIVNKTMGRTKKKTQTEMTEIERLQYEVEYLRTENALLKKVTALVEEEEKYQQESGRKPSKN